MSYCIPPATPLAQVQLPDASATATKVIALNLLPSGGTFDVSVGGSVTVVQDYIARNVSTVVLVADGWGDPDAAGAGGGSGSLVYQFGYIDPVTGNMTFVSNKSTASRFTFTPPSFAVDTNVTFVLVVEDEDGGQVTVTVTVLIPAAVEGAGIRWLQPAGRTATRWNPSETLWLAAVVDLEPGADVPSYLWSATYWNGTHSRELLLDDPSVAPSGNANATLQVLPGLFEEGAAGHVTVQLQVCLPLPCASFFCPFRRKCCAGLLPDHGRLTPV